MDYKKAHDDKKKELGELRQRMDDDADLIKNVDYVMKDSVGKPISDIVNVTMNRPLIFKTYVDSALSRAVEQVRVDSDDEKLDADHIEDCIRAGWGSANQRRMRQGMSDLDSYIDQQNCMRGRSCAVVLFQMVEGELDANIMLADTRYVTCEMGVDGLDWWGYEVYKTKGMIESEAWAQSIGYEHTGKGADILNLWTPEANFNVVMSTGPWLLAGSVVCHLAT